MSREHVKAKSLKIFENWEIKREWDLLYKKLENEAKIICLQDNFPEPKINFSANLFVFKIDRFLKTINPKYRLTNRAVWQLQDWDKQFIDILNISWGANSAIIDFKVKNKRIEDGMVETTLVREGNWWHWKKDQYRSSQCKKKEK